MLSKVIVIEYGTNWKPIGLLDAVQDVRWLKGQNWHFAIRPISSDVKRGQNLEAETEARALRSRPRPISWRRGQAEAKDEVMNKKYQMMIDNIQANLYHCDQNDTV